MEIPIDPRAFHSAAFSPYKPTGFHLHSGAGNALLPCLCAQHHLSPSCSQTEPGREGEEGFSGMIKLPLWRRLRFQLQQLWMQPWRWLCSAAPVVWGPGISGDLLLGGLAAAQKELLQICPLQMCFTGDVKRCKNFFRLLLGNDAGPNHQLVQITEIHKDWLTEPAGGSALLPSLKFCWSYWALHLGFCSGGGKLSGLRAVKYWFGETPLSSVP